MPQAAVDTHAPTTDSLGFTFAAQGCIAEVAADRGALVNALAEFGYRMVFEQADGDWGYELSKVDLEARAKVKRMIADELKQKQGYIPRPTA